MTGLFSRKPIQAESDRGMRRTLGAGDLIMLAIGAVIGAGIFASLGTAAAAATGDFATAAQGGKADTAVQPAATPSRQGARPRCAKRR